MRRLTSTRSCWMPKEGEFPEPGTTSTVAPSSSRWSTLPQEAVKQTPTPDYIYFSVENLDKIYARAQELGCLSKEKVHGERAGEIVTRPWGERSFYAEDPCGNLLCFVDERTMFTGR